jgi:hypothetical protein
MCWTDKHCLVLFWSGEASQRGCALCTVQVTAAAFAKGFLQLDGNLTPILVSLCRKVGRANSSAWRLLNMSVSSSVYCVCIICVITSVSWLALRD